MRARSASHAVRGPLPLTGTKPARHVEATRTSPEQQTPAADSETFGAAAAPFTGPTKLLERGKQFTVKSVKRSAIEKAAAARKLEDLKVPAGSKHVVVVGGGIAGLFAALQLKEKAEQQGVPLTVTLLEGSDHFGGRAKSDVIKLGKREIVVHQGAEMTTRADEEIMRALNKVGLEGELVENSPYVTVEHGGELERINRESVLSLKGTVMSNRTWWQNGQKALLEHDRELRGRSPNDPAHWLDKDDETGNWFEDELGADGARLIDGTVHSFFFQNPKEVTRALGLSLWAAALDGDRPESLRKGFGALTDKLAAEIGGVYLGARVQHIEPTKDGVDISVNGQVLHADDVVIATTADVAEKIYPAASPLERKLLDVKYVPTYNVVLDVDMDWSNDPALSKSFGIEVPPDELGPNDLIAAIALASGRDRTAPNGKETVQIMLDASRAALLKANGATGDEILELAVAEAERKGFLPGISKAARNYESVIEIGSALPQTLPGRFQAIENYEQHINPSSRIKFAGDFMGFPRIGSAALSGVSAAEETLNAMRVRDGEDVPSIRPARPGPLGSSTAENLVDDAGAYGAAVLGWTESVMRGDVVGAVKSYANGWSAVRHGVSDLLGRGRR